MTERFDSYMEKGMASAMPFFLSRFGGLFRELISIRIATRNNLKFVSDGGKRADDIRVKVPSSALVVS
jgi:hypothetical protein